MVKFGNSQRVVGYESGFDQYANALGSWQEAGNIFEQNRQRRRKEAMEDEEWPLLIEKLSLDNARLKDALAAAPGDRELRARAIDADIRASDAGIEDRDADRALRARAFDADDEERRRRMADDDRARAAWAKIGAAAMPRQGGAQPPAAGAVGADGVPNMLRRPSEGDQNNNGIPDELEMQDYDGETDRLMGEIAPLLGDLPPEQSSRLMSTLMGRRQTGRGQLRASQVAASVVTLAQAGALDQGMAQRAMAMLDAGMDPDVVSGQLDNLMAATEKQGAEFDLKASAQADADETLTNIKAIGHRLSPAALAEIATLRQRIVGPLTTGEMAMRAAEEIRKIAFKDAAGEGGGSSKPWHDSPAFLKLLDLHMGNPEKAMAAARAIGLPGVPEAPQAAPGQGQGQTAATPNPDLVRKALEVKVALEDQLGRPPTKAEIRAAMESEGSAEPAAPVDNAQSRAAEEYRAWDMKGAFERTRPPKRSLRDVAIEAGARLEEPVYSDEQVVKNEPGEFSEGEARKMFAQDPRLRFKRNPRGGWDLVAKNDLSRNTDPKGEVQYQ